MLAYFDSWWMVTEEVLNSEADGVWEASGCCYGGVPKFCFYILTWPIWCLFSGLPWLYCRAQCHPTWRLCSCLEQDFNLCCPPGFLVFIHPDVLLSGESLLAERVRHMKERSFVSRSANLDFRKLLGSYTELKWCQKGSLTYLSVYSMVFSLSSATLYV